MVFCLWSHVSVKTHNTVVASTAGLSELLLLRFYLCFMFYTFLYELICGCLWPHSLSRTDYPVSFRLVQLSITKHTEVLKCLIYLTHQPTNIEVSHCLIKAITSFHAISWDLFPNSPASSLLFSHCDLQDCFVVHCCFFSSWAAQQLKPVSNSFETTAALQSQTCWQNRDLRHRNRLVMNGNECLGLQLQLRQVQLWQHCLL